MGRRRTDAEPSRAQSRSRVGTFAASAAVLGAIACLPATASVASTGTSTAPTTVNDTPSPFPARVAADDGPGSIPAFDSPGPVPPFAAAGSAAANGVSADFDGDGRTDIAVWRRRVDSPGVRGGREREAPPQ